LIYDTFTLDFKVIADLTSPAAVSGK